MQLQPQRVIILFAFILALVGACRDRSIQVIPQCPGYGSETPVALCAELINAYCFKAQQCEDATKTERPVECLQAGLQMCSEAVVGNPESVYGSCLPYLQKMDCSELQAETPPKECEEAFDFRGEAESKK